MNDAEKVERLMRNLAKRFENETTEVSRSILDAWTRS